MKGTIIFYRNFLIILAVAGMITSCKKDFLDKQPYGGLPTNESILTVEDMQIAVNGTYATLRAPELYGRTIPLFADLLADNVYISTENSNRYLDFFYVNYTVSNANAEGIWQKAYSAILNANNVINSSLKGTAQIDQLRGEALCLRALMYFELAKHFSKPYTVDPAGAGVPLILSYDAFLKPKRNTVAEVYTQIQKDLTDAIPLLTLPKSSGFFTQYAAEALLARMYQFKGEWAHALSVSQDIIDNSGFTLLKENQLTGYWGSNTPRTDGLETLFEVVFDLVGNAGIDALPYFYDQNGYGDALATQDLYDAYSSTDIRRSLILESSPVRGDVRVVNKYPNSSQPDLDEFKVLRLSEVYLIAAEAAYQVNDESTALDYVNTIATNRDASFTGYSSSGADLLSDIILERRKELAFEGHRYWDLARYNVDVERKDVNDNYSDLGAPLSIPANSFRRIMPIPQSEIDANPVIRDQQNSGY